MSQQQLDDEFEASVEDAKQIANESIAASVTNALLNSYSDFSAGGNKEGFTAEVESKYLGHTVITTIEITSKYVAD